MQQRKSAGNTFSLDECRALTSLCIKVLAGDLKGAQQIIRGSAGVRLYSKFLAMRERILAKDDGPPFPSDSAS